MIHKPKFERAKSLFHLSDERFGLLSVAIALGVIICIWIFAIARTNEEQDESLKNEIAKNTNLVLSHERQVSSATFAIKRKWHKAPSNHLFYLGRFAQSIARTHR
jgi:hypothetical protein